MRGIEGAKLADDLLVRKAAILAWVADIEKEPLWWFRNGKYAWKSALKSFLGETYRLDENRMANEVAIFADRASIARGNNSLAKPFRAIGANAEKR